MRAGQTDKAVTVRDDRLEMIGQIIGEKLGQIGALDSDAFITKHGCYVIDMKPVSAAVIHSPILPERIFQQH